MGNKRAINSQRIAIQLGGEWAHGYVRISGRYDGAGCYAIADSGKKYHEMNKDAPEPTQEGLLHQVNAAMAEGMSLQEVLRVIDDPQLADLFCGYYFEDDYRDVIGLCTGRRAIPR